MDEQLALQNLLRIKLTEIQRSNPRYSLRAYAKRVGVHVGALTYIMNGKRNVSRTLAERIATRLLLDPQERSEILRRFPDRKRIRKPDDARPDPTALAYRYLELNATQFKIAAEWEHFAVLSLMNCEDFESRSEWVARRLGITIHRAEQVIERMMQLGLVVLDASGQLTRAQPSIRTPDDMADISLKKHHEESLELAKTSLHRDPIEVRDFTTITMAIDPKKLSAAKDLIRKYSDELSDLLESGHRTEVYRFSTQLFPLSKLERVGK